MHQALMILPVPTAHYQAIAIHQTTFSQDNLSQKSYESYSDTQDDDQYSQQSDNILASPVFELGRNLELVNQLNPNPNPKLEALIHDIEALFFRYETNY